METVPQAKQVHCKKHQNCCVRDQWQRGLWGGEHLLDQKMSVGETFWLCRTAEENSTAQSNDSRIPVVKG